MAKDPAFLFYYDRFLSGTISMTDAEVGQYIRLLCIQANKGHITKKDMYIICESYDCDVSLKFTETSPGQFQNLVLHEILEQRRNYAESRRNNRKGLKNKDSTKKQPESYDTTYDSHMVNVIVNKDVNTNTKRVQIILPFDTPEFRTAWAAWIKHRNEMKKPLRETSQQAALKKLSNHPEHTAIQMIEQSISNGWLGLFPIETKQAHGRTIQEQRGTDPESTLQRLNRYRDIFRDRDTGKKPNNGKDHTWIITDMWCDETYSDA